nr:hypothetical protein [uncultured Schaedlerella sp.]
MKCSKLICCLICSIMIFSAINVQAAEEVKSSNILFEERISQAEKQFLLETDMLQGTEQVSPRTPGSLGVSVCLGSFCAGSVCLGSGCFFSACGSSGCTQSGCAGSGCVNSGCIGSSCLGSFCLSACVAGCK